MSASVKHKDVGKGLDRAEWEAPDSHEVIIDHASLTNVLPSQHHAKTTTVGELTDHDTAAHDALDIDADTVDGAHKTDLESTMDGKITTHKGDAAAHHAKYTDAEAQATVKAAVEVGDLKAPTKPLGMNNELIWALGVPTETGHALRKGTVLTLTEIPTPLTGKDADSVDGKEPGTTSGKLAILDANARVQDSAKLEGSTKTQVQDHTPKAHTLASHSTKAHSELTGVTSDQHHAHPGARVYNNAAQLIPTGVDIALAFNSERYDTDGIHSTVTNNSRLTCKTAGKYLITGHVQWYFGVGTAGHRDAYIGLNGTGNWLDVHRMTVGVNEMGFNHVATVWNLDVNDYVELVVMQSSGGDLDVLSTDYHSPEFAMQRIG